MNIAIVWTAYNRPQYFERVMESWRNVRGIDDVKKYVFLEPSDQKPAMLRILNESSLDIEVIENETKNGVLHNPWVAMDHAFKEGADFVILAEEDLIVSTDILEYFHWASSYMVEDELGVCAFSYDDQAVDPTVVKVLEDHGGYRFNVWVWGTWKSVWEEVIRDSWDHDYSTGPADGTQAGWDWELGRTTKRLDRPFVAPEVSRSQHIGMFGTHVTPQQFERDQSYSFRAFQPKMHYRWTE